MDGIWSSWLKLLEPEIALTVDDLMEELKDVPVGLRWLHIDGVDEVEIHCW